MITINWMKPKPPTIAQRLQKVRQVYMMEHMLVQLQLKVLKRDGD